jgi:hypothetical protein
VGNTDSWICATCATPQAGSYCPCCGDEKLRPHDLTARDVAVQASQSLSSLDGRVPRSFRMVLTQPGALTQAHVRGQRRAFLGPAQLFFIANALFFAVQSFTHFAILSSPLDSHMYRQDWSELARQLVSQHLAAEHLSLDLYAAAFNEAVAFNAKALIILMVLAFTPVAALLFYRKDRPIGVHVVFALHVYTFVLLLFCLSLLIVGASVSLGGPGLDNGPMDLAMSLFNVTVCAFYLYFAIGTAYGAAGWTRIAWTAALTLAIAGIVIGYRFAIFLITLATT